MSDDNAMSSNGREEGRQADRAGRPVSFLIGWGIPLLAVLATSFLAIPMWVITLVWVAGFAWMGIGCVLNARRCGRRHCFYSGPVLLLGAIAVALVGSEVVSLGPHGFVIVVWSTFALVLLTFVPEWIGGKYVRR